MNSILRSIEMLHEAEAKLRRGGCRGKKTLLVHPTHLACQEMLAWLIGQQHQGVYDVAVYEHIKGPDINILEWLPKAPHNQGQDHDR